MRRHLSAPRQNRVKSKKGIFRVCTAPGSVRLIFVVLLPVTLHLSAAAVSFVCVCVSVLYAVQNNSLATKSVVVYTKRRNFPELTKCLCLFTHAHTLVPFFKKKITKVQNNLPFRHGFHTSNPHRFPRTEKQIRPTK